jgi:sulfate/thiosulfate transport system permease protein
MAKYALRTAALGYLLLLLVLPVGLIIWRTFGAGLSTFGEVVTSPQFLHALQLTVEVALWAVAANTVFGVGAALLLVRHDFPGKRLFNAVIDLPLAVSPVVVGLALILVYGRFAPAGRWLENAGIQVIFSVPGMVLATVFVSLPLVVRAVAPVLQEMGEEQEQAAHTLGRGRRSGASPSPASAGRSVTASCSAWRAHSASTARSPWSPAGSSGRPRR